MRWHGHMVVFRAAEAEAAELGLRHDVVCDELATATAELDAASATFKAEMAGVFAEKLRTKTLMAAQSEWQAKIQESEVNGSRATGRRHPKNRRKGRT